MSPARPYSGNEITSVFTFAEVVLLNAFFINIIASFYLDTCIDDRDKVDTFFFHFIDIGLKVREVFLIDCEIFVVFHVIDIHVYHIDWNIVFTISVSSFSEVVSSCISPAALTETKCEFRRDIASSNDFTELFYDIVRSFTLDHIQIKVCILTGDL